MLPRAQYSASQEPVAKYFGQIKDVTNAFRQCRDTGRGINLVSSQVHLNDHGIVDFSTSDSMGPNPPFGAAVANLDLDNPHVNDHDPGCLLVGLDCKNGGRCVRQGADAMAWLSFWVNTREQADTIIEALKEIAAFYAEGQGDVHN